MMYKAVTRQAALNKLLKEHVVPRFERVKRIRFLFANRVIHLRGVIREGEERVFGFKTGDIYFDFRMIKEEVNAQTVKMRLSRSRFFSSSRIDLIKLSSRISSKLEDILLYHLTRGDSPFFMVNRKKRFIGFDLNFILMQIPPGLDVLGKINIVNVSFEPRRIVWFLNSNLLLQSIVQIFKPDYVEIEKIEIESDAQKLLTDINLIE
ncbi:MAG: hypothetical protein LDLANPLL_00257 [Turneriella sp.]|nr:hypothetical protein [Turneriella sp.]